VIVAEGILITIFVLTGLRELILNAIPMDLKRAIGIGIGLFIAFIGLVNAGVVVQAKPGPVPPVTIVANFRSWSLALFVFGLLLTSALVARRVKGALLIGIVATTVAATIVNEVKHLGVFTDGSAAWPGFAHLTATPNFSLVGNFSFGFFSSLGFWTAAAIVISVMLSDFFDTIGTVIGIGGEAKMLDADGRLPGIKRVLLVDSLAAVAGGAASASSNTTYIESASGVSQGGRTGLTAVVVGALFLLCMFFSPIAGIVPAVATAPILVIVGYYMMTLVKDIDWADPGIGIPVLLTVALMPFTYSITNGVGAGFLSYTVIAVLRGRARDVHPLMYLVSAIFAWYFIHGVVG
jgi:AGZA family xanthine/uracil permease-like MFS transporter